MAPKFFQVLFVGVRYGSLKWMGLHLTPNGAAGHHSTPVTVRLPTFAGMNCPGSTHFRSPDKALITEQAAMPVSTANAPINHQLATSATAAAVKYEIDPDFVR